VTFEDPSMKTENPKKISDEKGPSSLDNRFDAVKKFTALFFLFMKK
jgi:hypothetical protein